MDKNELKNVILELFDLQCKLNAMLAEKDSFSEEKDLRIAYCPKKLTRLSPRRTRSGLILTHGWQRGASATRNVKVFSGLYHI